MLFLDALPVNCRQDGRTVNKALYVALAINGEGITSATTIKQLR
ncbi:MAG: transposase [Treponema sp.]